MIPGHQTWHGKLTLFRATFKIKSGMKFTVPAYRFRDPGLPGLQCAARSPGWIKETGKEGTEGMRNKEVEGLVSEADA